MNNTSGNDQAKPDGEPLWLRRTGLLLRRWVEEPIGLFVPLIAALLMLFAPQMPDMFTAMIDGDGINGDAPAWWQAALELGLPAASLGLAAWYWTRAGLWEACTLAERIRFFAHVRGARSVPTPSDRQHMERWLDGGHTPSDDDDWSWIWAPRLAILLGGLTALSPIILTLFDDDIQLTKVPWGPLLAPLPVLVALPLVAWRRDFGLAWTAPTPLWMWRFRPLALLAAAPLGWPVAVFMLGISAAGSVAVGLWPQWVERTFATPTSALLALGLLIGPLTFVLTLLREVMLRILVWITAGAAWLKHRDFEPGLRPESIGLTGPANVIALVSLLSLLYFDSPFGEPANRYGVRKTESALAEGCTPESPCRWPAKDTLRRPNLCEAVGEWYDARSAGGPGDRAVPAIIVAAEGGASRAAVWMLSAMRMLDDKTGNEFGRHLFAISGVSGGSLGAVTYLQALARHGDAHGLNWSQKSVEEGLEALAHGDLLSASIATYFLNDTLGRLFGILWSAPDRGIVLERAFERHWQRPDGFEVPKENAESGLIALHRGAPKGLPHLLLNGTDRGTGRRLITSTLRFDPEDDLFAGSDDFLAILKHDVPSATAVSNSARFPYISPAGRFVDGQNKSRQVLDGGYFENYGTRTAAELAAGLSRIAADPVRHCGRRLNVVPVVVVISNDADAARTPAEAEARKLNAQAKVTITCENKSLLPVETAENRDQRNAKNVSEFMAPLSGFYATRSAHNLDAQYILRRQLCTVPDSHRLIHIALPKPQPGVEAAPMNWVLNGRAANFLLRSAYRENDFNSEQAGKLHKLLSDFNTLSANFSQ